MTIKVVGVCGNSGSGKTELIQRSIDEYPDYFHKVDQITTRSPRDGEAAHYSFVNDFLYDLLLEKDFLTAVTSFDSARYGSLLDSLHPEKINLVALSTEGFISLQNSCRDRGFELVSLGLVKPVPLEEELSGRENRNLEEEMDFIPFMQHLKELKPGEYFSNHDLMELVKEWQPRPLLNSFSRNQTT